MSAPFPFDIYDEATDYGALETRVLQHYLGEKAVESLEETLKRDMRVDMGTGAILSPTGRIVWDDPIKYAPYGKAANERYKAFYQRQNFDLRFGHLFPVYPAKHTLLNTTALRVIGA